MANGLQGVLKPTRHTGIPIKKMRIATLCYLFLAVSILAVPAPLAAGQNRKLAADMVTDGQPIDIGSQRYRDLFAELERKHGFARKELLDTFRGVTIKRRVLELMDHQWEARPWYEYWPRFITPAVVREGREKLRMYRRLLDRVEERFGVERQYLVAIWGIESGYGRHKGAFRIFQTLNTLFDAYPRRSEFYRGQLISFLLLCRENGIDPRGVTGSYGGAFGQTQFIPSSFREYAVDFDGDGRRDVWSSVADIVASIANYLHRYKWKFGAPVYVELGGRLRDARLEKVCALGRRGLIGWQELARLQKVELPPAPVTGRVTIVKLEEGPDRMRYVAGYPNFQAITKWNHSNRYAMAVSLLAQRLAAGAKDKKS